MKKLTSDHFALTVDSTRGKIVQAVLAAQTGMARLSLEQNARIARLAKMQETLEEDLACIIERGTVRVRVKKLVTKPGKTKGSKITVTTWDYVERELSLDEKIQLTAMTNRSIEVLMTMLKEVNKPVLDFPTMERFLREVESMRTGADGEDDMVKFIESMPPEFAKEVDRQLRIEYQNVVDGEFTEIEN